MKTENHPVGFRKYILLAAFGYRLRLHVWSFGEGNPSRHNHRWWFLSLPVRGRFIETRYQELPGERYMKIDVHDKHGFRDGDRAYRPSGESDLDVLAQRVRRPFRPYYCPPNAVHSLVPRDVGRLHASLVLCGRLQRDTSVIWRAKNNVDVPLDTSEDGI